MSNMMDELDGYVRDGKAVMAAFCFWLIGLAVTVGIGLGYFLLEELLVAPTKVLMLLGGIGAMFVVPTLVGFLVYRGWRSRRDHRDQNRAVHK